MPLGWLALVAVFVLTAPALFVLGPLAGLLLVARPVSRRAALWFGATAAWSAWWVAQPGGLGTRFVAAFGLALSGAAMVSLGLFPARPFRQAWVALALATAVTAGWCLVFGIGWGHLTSAAASALGDAFRAQADAITALGGSAGDETAAALRQMAGQARAVVAYLPAALAISALAGLALAWRGQQWIAPAPLGGPPRPFAAFTFSDQAVWAVVLPVAALVIPGTGAVPGLRVGAANVLAVAVACYAVRGLAVLRAGAGAGRVPAASIALFAALVLFMFPFVASGLTVMGLADTWLDFRRRLAAPTTGGFDR